jgi:hypothetical protein
MYTPVFVTSNGLLAFSGGGSDNFGNEALPSPTEPPTTRSAPSGTTWTRAKAARSATAMTGYGNRVIFQWNNVAHNGDYITGNYVSHFTFQAVLYPDGTIDLNYQDMSGYYTGSATVGIENADGTMGLTATLEGSGASTMDGTTIRFRAPQPRPTRGGPSRRLRVGQLPGPRRAGVHVHGHQRHGHQPGPDR